VSFVVLICGNRTWNDWKPIRELVRSLPDGAIVVEGEARGADTIARICAEQRGLEVRKYPAQWKVYGKAAGPLRNQQMLNAEHPDIVVAFTYNLATSKGTRDMVERARKTGIPTEVRP
jgi:hypothetical protein